VRFLIDENFNPCLKFILDEWGHDARAVALEPALRGLADEVLFGLAVAEKRAIVTFNRSHYVRLAEAARGTGQDHPGLVTCPDRKGYAGFADVVHWMRRMLAGAAVEVSLCNEVRRLESFR
jgi:hypothetical protein